jgi:lysophospholipase L1-like esterase
MYNHKLPRSYKIILFLMVFSVTELSDQPFEKKLNLDIVYIGNSITQGAQLAKPEEEAPPAASSDYLRRQSGIGDVKFINQGRSGYTTVDYLPSGKGALSEVITAAHQLHKDPYRQLLFTISLGTNDSAENGPNGSPVDPADYQKNLKSITDKLLTEFTQCKIVLLQPIWYSPNTYNSAKYMSEGLARLQSYFPELQSLVLKYSLTNPGQVFLGDLKGFAYFRNNYLTDLIPESGNAGTFYLHPNKKGANVLGKLWGEAIYESLFKDAGR